MLLLYSCSSFSTLPFLTAQCSLLKILYNNSKDHRIGGEHQKSSLACPESLLFPATLVQMQVFPLKPPTITSEQGEKKEDEVEWATKGGMDVGGLSSVWRWGDSGCHWFSPEQPYSLKSPAPRLVQCTAQEPVSTAALLVSNLQHISSKSISSTSALLTAW